MDGETVEDFAAVEIVLRKAGQPQPGQKFIALLHEVAALVDFSQKQADRNVFGNFSFDASQFTGRLLDPYKATHFREDRSEEIGRASCRERVQIAVVARAL